jgi:hypothetical protein
LSRAAGIRVLAALPFVLPGVLLAWLSFDAGGYFARDTAVAAIVVGIVLGVRVVLADRPFAGFTWPAAAAAVSLALLGGWAWLSGSWSDSEGRALFELNRILFYLLLFVLLASIQRTDATMRWLVRGLALGALVVGGCALVTRTLPDVWATAPDVANDRLSYPLTYWNALGAIIGIGTLLCFALTCDLRERLAVRIAAAGALPVLGAALLFTFSRGSMALVVFGLLAIAAGARTRGVLSGLVPLAAAAVALAAAYSADLLASDEPTSAAATSQGHEVFTAVVLCALAAMAMRWTMYLQLDRRKRRVRPERQALPARRWAAVGLVAALCVAGAGLAAGGAAALDRQYDRFVQGGVIQDEGDLRERLVNPGNNGRIAQWRVAERGFQADRVKGEGAGTYRLLWDRWREKEYQLEDAHSLYLEMLAELGLVGLLLLAVPMVIALVALARRCRGPARVPAVGLFAAAAFWVVHAGIDWDWEMPAVTLAFFAAGGAALAAAPRAEDARPRTSLLARVPVLVVLAALLVIPAFVTASERPALRAKQAFDRRDCATTTREAERSVDVLAVRSEPYELLGYCALREGRAADGLAAMTEAVERDPHNWRVHYGLSLALAVNERDPRPAIKVARRLNPREHLAYDVSDAFSKTTDPRSWKRRALRARLPRN